MTTGFKLRNSDIEFSVTGQKGIIANLYSFDHELRRDIVMLNRRFAPHTRGIAQAIVPVDTGRSRHALTAELSPEELTFKVFYDKSVYDNDGVAYYPQFFELGTSRQAAQPTLIPAFERVAPQYNAELRDAIRGAIRRIG
jgi:hypothetical protein